MRNGVCGISLVVFDVCNSRSFTVVRASKTRSFFLIKFWRIFVFIFVKLFDVLVLIIGFFELVVFLVKWCKLRCLSRSESFSKFVLTSFDFDN